MTVPNQAESSTQHTPGPWRAGYEDGSDPTTVMTVATREKFAKVGIRSEYQETPTKRSVTLTRDDSLPPRSFGQLADIICEMYTGDDDLPDADRRANARLIAAAPDLLEALEVADETLASIWKINWAVMRKRSAADIAASLYDSYAASRRVVASAIAQAEGETA